ncbi:hypothetical protein [Streptococcus iniae]|nr:hypothetical protein [Streptococcus iniae]
MRSHRKESHGTNNHTKSDCNSNIITFADYAYKVRQHINDRD